MMGAAVADVARFWLRTFMVLVAGLAALNIVCIFVMEIIGGAGEDEP